MTIVQWKAETVRLLKQAKLDESADLDARLLLQKATGMDQIQQLIAHDHTLSEQELANLSVLRSQRLAHKPMAYILKEKEFFGRPFAVDERVLIPRPDTETLIEAVLAFAHTKDRASLLPIIDVCTGSGAIGITLALELDVEVTLSDISNDALQVADSNARALLGHSLPLVEDDLLAHAAQTYGIIVSNPPYLNATWCEQVSKEVSWEPRLALDGFGSDGLDLIRTLVAQSTRYLRNGGALFLECDYRQAKQVAAMLVAHQFGSVTIEQDLAGLDRVVWGVHTCTNN
ncbi:MAG: peptide chain release factor N(5)-glutamine methyltransferase [Sphaerochaeta sp.]|uniref:peptide chain release factor N(5)-glutamine methyltransferase n=1 Tax=Sphaerochaeta sp. TaxID=1972642 RepID=UPI003D0C56CA